MSGSTRLLSLSLSLSLTLAQALAALRTELGEEAFAAAWAEGGAMTLEEAIADALEEPDADARP